MDTTNMTENKKAKMKTTDIVFIAIMATLIYVCSWISIPIGAVPITLQTFGVFMAVGLLGGKRGTLAVIVYILLGLITRGPAYLASATSGYIIGFIGAALIMWALEFVLTGTGIKRDILFVLSMVAGLIICYIFGTVWFMVFYTTHTGELELLTCLSWCVFPFIIPDFIKIVLAASLVKPLKRFIPE